MDFKKLQTVVLPRKMKSYDEKEQTKAMEKRGT